MKTERNRKRLNKIELALTPDPVVVSWVEDLAQFDSLHEYAVWVSRDFTRAPLPKMFRKIESSISASLGSRQTSEDLLHKRCRATRFLFYLLLVLNYQVREFLAQEESHLNTMRSSIQTINERVSSTIMTYEHWKGLLETPYPLAADIAAAVFFALRNDVTQIDEWASEIAEQHSNHFAGEVADEAASFQANCARLTSTVHDLCRKGLIRRGLRVNLGRSLFEFLAEIPLIEEVWIDLTAVELAECAAILDWRGFNLNVASDPHPLAPMQLRQRKETTAEHKTTLASEDEVGSARAEAAARLATFVGRTRGIEGRPYIHLDDYRAWSERVAGEDLEVSEGFVTASWNAWIEANGGNPTLAGIPVRKLRPSLQQNDFFACEDPGRRRRREERASLIKMSTKDRRVAKLEGLLKVCRDGICRSLTEVRTIALVAERLTARYFPGLKILFRSDVKDLDDLTASITRLLDVYNDLVDCIDAEQTSIRFGPKLGARIEKIDQHALDAGVEERAVALFGTLVALAKAETLSSIGEGEKAMRILGPLLRG
jgi:hypothetical protein